MQSHTKILSMAVYKIKSINQEGRFNKIWLLYVSAEANVIQCYWYYTRATKTSVCMCFSHFSVQSSVLTEEVMNVGVMILMAFLLLQLRSLWGQRPSALVKQTDRIKYF